MSVFGALVAFVEAVVWIGGWSMLVGLPLAWLRLRGSRAWVGRPDEGRSLDLMLLGEFVHRTVWVAILWAWLTLVALEISDWEVSSIEYLFLIWGPPTVFVPCAVLSLDVGRFPRIVEELGRDQ
jgi:hypothetical protein